MSRYAQTNIQLYAQLGEAGYGPADMERVVRGYEFSLRLFTAAFRGSGKPFLAHLVGTASVLGAVRAPSTVVTAGLLHAAYEQGEWGNGWYGVWPERRAALAEAVGADTEDLVVRYHRLAWTTDSIAGLRTRLDALSGAERAVTLMRLANDVDDHLDLGVLYCADAERRLREMRARRVPCVAMAEALGGPELRDALAAAYADVDRADLPAMLRRTDGSSYRLPPASHQTRPRVALSHLLARRPWRSRRRGRPENPRESEDT